MRTVELLFATISELLSCRILPTATREMVPVVGESIWPRALIIYDQNAEMLVARLELQLFLVQIP
jgi:hypothetical protein